MSFNKAKSLKAASKHVQQGKFQAAIEEYRKIVQADPGDMTTLNTLGDLFVKTGDNGEAIRTFLKIAEHYRAGSFNLKAVAMLKKVSKLDPQNIEVALKLAGLYAQQKLIVDARQQYLSVAEHYLRAGQQKYALDIYQKIAALDPENTAIQLKLAEAYLHEHQPERAYEAFIAAASELQRQGKHDEALEIYLKALHVRPEAQTALNAAVNIYIQRGEAQRAADLITRLLQNQPNNAELLTLLGRIHQSVNNLNEAEKSLARAVEVDPSRFHYLIDFAEVALRFGDTERTLRQIDRVMEQLFERREEEKAIAVLHEIIARDPSHFGALERLATIFARIREDHNLIDTLNSLADAAIRKGEDEVAIKSLVQLTQLEPDEIKHRRRLRSLGLTDEEVRRLSDSMESTVTRTPSPPRPEAISQPMIEPPAPEFAPPAPAAGAVWGEIDLNSSTQEIMAPPTMSQTPVSAFGEIEISLAPPDNNQFFAFGQEEVVDSHEEVSPAWLQTQANGFDFGAMEISLTPDPPEALAPGNIVTGFVNEDYPAPQPVTFSAVVAEPPASQDFSFTPADEVEVSGGLKLNDELESVDFYIAQGMLDVAQHTLEMLEGHFPGNPAISERRALLAQSESATLSPIEPDAFTFPDTNQHQHNLETTEIVPLSPGFEDQASAFTFDLPEPTLTMEFSEPAGTALVAPAGQDLQTGSQFDVFSEDLTTLPTDSAAGTPLNVRPTTRTASPAMVSTENNDPASSLNDLFNLFDEFKTGAEMPEPETGDFDTHYNLGLAYKDMEMYDDAVEEFQQAYKALSAETPSEDARQYLLLCCSMLGFCFSQKNLPRLAVMWLRKGLEVPGRTEDEYQALRYDLANAFEAMGDLKNAYDTLQEVYAIDVNYRGVSTRLTQVQAQLAGQ
jgi:tetratricopeptide (TPR) repeat protein